VEKIFARGVWETGVEGWGTTGRSGSRAGCADEKEAGTFEGERVGMRWMWRDGVVLHFLALGSVLSREQASSRGPQWFAVSSARISF